jgi:hypothetical protein
MCDQLLRFVSDDGRTEIRAHDVERVLRENANVLGDMLSDTYWHELSPKLAKRGAGAARLAVQMLVLAILIGQPRSKDVYDTESFDQDEARNRLYLAIDVLLSERQALPLKQLFEDLDIHDTLRRMTLTLIIEPRDRDKGRFGFLSNIYPRFELQRCGSQPGIERRFVMLAEQLSRNLAAR